VVQTHYIPESEALQAINEGLSREPKTLPSWMLYDQSGDRLFEQIMQLPEYYPTRCEYEIINRYKVDLAKYFVDSRKPFSLIELGAGNGLKTEILLRTLLGIHANFTYVPIDVSSSALIALSSRLLSNYESLDIKTLNADYDEALDSMPAYNKKVLLFLGANIGNMRIDEASEFLTKIATRFSKKDVLVVGFDLKKDPRVIEAAYNDSAGITREFNLNILKRLNATMKADFNLQQFEHYPEYNPETGTASSYLVSLKDQNVHVGAIGKTFHFGQWETIHTEISQKYDLLMIDKMLNDAGFEIADLFFDKAHYFCDVVAVKT
jgi:L-histidine Nalpha-methyltransferase